MRLGKYFPGNLRKDLTCVVQGVSGKRSVLDMFKDGNEKDMTPNQLTIMILKKITVTEEFKVPVIYVIPDETIH